MKNQNKKNNTSIISKEPQVSEFKTIIKDLVKNDNFLALKSKNQHAHNSRFYHCLCVSYYTYYICKKLNLDYVSATRGALLHDFYFYDWRNKNVEGQNKLHAFMHPRIALNNALDIFELNKKEQDIILKHMWPLTVIFPRYKESYIVTLVDKYCATYELIKAFKRKRKERRH